MRMRDMKNMVGAWHVGRVLDMKAGKMPYMEGGPVETGYRLTVNVDIGWCDYRALRHKFSPTGSPVQFGDMHLKPWKPPTSPCSSSPTTRRSFCGRPTTRRTRCRKAPVADTASQ